MIFFVSLNLFTVGTKDKMWLIYMKNRRDKYLAGI